MNDESGGDKSSKSPGKKTNIKAEVFFLGLYHLFMALLFVYLLIMVWPNNTKGSNGEIIADGTLNIFGFELPIGTETRFLLLVIISAGLGSFIHASTSFVSYVGNKRLVMSWAWWYIVRPFIGMSLALIFYFVIRGGLLSTGTSTTDISVFGIAAVAGLVGMFSKQATDKLGEVFETLFRTKQGVGDDERKDKLGEKILVTEKMIPVNKITSYIIPENQPLNKINIEVLYNLLSETITRVPVLDNNGVLKFVIHQSAIYKFIFEKSREASKKGEAFNLKELTFDDFLNHQGIKELVSEAVAFLPKNATILHAKEEMEKIKYCQDVFVTESGKREEKILGWLTNVDIGKCLSA